MMAMNPAIARVELIANRLGHLKERVVFLGGAATGLLVTDPGVSSIRPTKDVDVIVLSAYLEEATERIIREEVFKDTADV